MGVNLRALIDDNDEHPNQKTNFCGGLVMDLTDRYTGDGEIGSLYLYAENVKDLISFDGFNWGRFEFPQSELNILQPQLENLGFTVTGWWTGEADSFGVLTRCATMYDANGTRVVFCYG